MFVVISVILCLPYRVLAKKDKASTLLLLYLRPEMTLIGCTLNFDIQHEVSL